ncbi:MAG: MarR family winged helix-turn-helix transcriptional regulator [Candidatus Nanopelagicales bacterium]
MTRWLSADEQRLWRGWLAASMLLPDRLNRDLQQAHGLTDTDYMILVELSESPQRRMRMSALAEFTLLSRSRLSHQVDRMERAGYVSRSRCTEDGRGTFAQLTDLGYQTLAKAAPDHVASVRRNLMDALTPEEFTALGEACIKVSEHLGGCQLWGSPNADRLASGTGAQAG